MDTVDENSTAASARRDWAPGYRHMTPDFAPVDVTFRASPATFRVEEIPRHTPAGTGDHLWFQMEKRGIGTRTALKRIASALGRRERDFGYAGLKDAAGTTVQWCSIEHEDEARLVELGWEDLALGQLTRSTRKMRVGWLDGNRFTLLFEGSGAHQVAVRELLEQLELRGVPNYFGPQRFGRDSDGHETGRALWLGDAREFVLLFLEHGNPGARAAAAGLRNAGTGEAEFTAEDARRHAARSDRERAGVLRRLARESSGSGVIDWEDLRDAVPARSRRFACCALQSRVFNRVVAARLALGADALGRVYEGDLVFRHRDGERRGALFEIASEDLVGEQAEVLAERLACLEISPSGPLFGPRMGRAGGVEDGIEIAALQAERLELEDVMGARGTPSGARRPLRVPLREVCVERLGEDLEVGFSLPAGSFASVVVEEIRKKLPGSGAALQMGNDSGR